MQENTFSFNQPKHNNDTEHIQTNTELIRMRHQSIKFRRTERHPLIADGGKERKDRQTDGQNKTNSKPKRGSLQSTLKPSKFTISKNNNTTEHC